MDLNRYYVDSRRASVNISMLLMAIAGVLRLVWWILWPEELSTAFSALTQGALPILACLLYLVLVPVCGKQALWTTFIPVLLGVIFFISKATGFVWWHQLLCTALYLLVAVLYGLTVFGILPTQKLLIPLFGLPLFYHLVIQDLITNLTVYTLQDWIKEGSVLCIMAALLCLSIAMAKNPEDEKQDL